MKELFEKYKDKIIKAVIGVILAVVCALLGYKVSDVIPTDKTQEIINNNVKPVQSGAVVAPAPAPAPAPLPAPPPVPAAEKLEEK